MTAIDESPESTAAAGNHTAAPPATLRRRRAYERLLRPLLFRLPPERAHDLGRFALERELPWRILASRLVLGDPRLRTEIGGLRIANPIGLSAGFDKNAEALPGLQHLGFGYVTVGSILPERRQGNPKPRLLRYPDRESLLNSYGLPSDGLDACLARLRSFRGRGRGSTSIIANIDAPDVESYLRSFAAVEPYIDGVELGLQCPNNRDDDGGLHEPANFERLLQAIAQMRHKPVFVKMLSYADERERRNRLELVELAVRYGVDAIVIPGNWKTPEPRLAVGIGATSGRMTFGKALKMVRDVYSVTRGRVSVKANGGIFTGKDAFDAIAAGADAIDILTAFVYRGWTAAFDINRELLALLEERQIPSVRHIRPAATS